MAKSIIFIKHVAIKQILPFPIPPSSIGTETVSLRSHKLELSISFHQDCCHIFLTPLSPQEWLTLVLFVTQASLKILRAFSVFDFEADINCVICPTFLSFEWYVDRRWRRRLRHGTSVSRPWISILNILNMNRDSMVVPRPRLLQFLQGFLSHGHCQTIPPLGIFELWNPKASMEAAKKQQAGHAP